MIIATMIVMVRSTRIARSVRQSFAMASTTTAMATRTKGARCVSLLARCAPRMASVAAGRAVMGSANLPVVPRA